MNGTPNRFEFPSISLASDSDDDAGLVYIELYSDDDSPSVQSASTNTLPPQWQRYAAVGRRVPTVQDASTVVVGPRSYARPLTSRGRAWRALACVQTLLPIAFFLYTLWS